MSVGCPEPEPPRSLPCCGPGTAPGLGAGVPLLTEDMQALTLRTLAASDVTKHYELVRELGKGTYGKVDLVAYKGTGEHLPAVGVKAGGRGAGGLAWGSWVFASGAEGSAGRQSSWSRWRDVA